MAHHLQQPINPIPPQPPQGGTSGLVDTATRDAIWVIEYIDTVPKFVILLVLLIFIGWIIFVIASKFGKVSGENGHTVRKGRLSEETFMQVERNSIAIKEMRDDFSRFMATNRDDHRAVSDKIDRLNQNIFSLALNQTPYPPDRADPPKKTPRRVPVKRKN